VPAATALRGVAPLVRAARRDGAAAPHARVIGSGVTMTDLASFPVTSKWPARHPERLQLYSLPTPNGVKVSVMLE